MSTAHGQHYLLSAEARSLSLMQIMRLSDEQASEMFKEARWGKGPVACPCCGGVEHYWLKNRSQWRCKHKECGQQFSLTSGTIFHSAKMPIRVYLAAIALWSNCAKGMSALQMSARRKACVFLLPKILVVITTKHRQHPYAALALKDAVSIHVVVK